MGLTPGQGAPDGAYTVGHVSTAQNYTTSTIKAALNGAPIEKYTNAQNVHNAEVKQPIASNTAGVANHEGRIVTLEDGGTMVVYTGNATWQNPGTGRIGVGIINGGQAGQDGLVISSGTNIRLGGNHGGYSYKEFDASELTATVAVTVGVGGSTAYALGNVSSFGSYLSGVSGITGAVMTNKGVVTSGSTPGVGGNNGGGGDSSPGLAGSNSALATGGAGGIGGVAGAPATNGSPGGSVDTGSLTPCGGAGGGAGGGTDFQHFVNPVNVGGGTGGAGGAPGAGGGAGGNDRYNSIVGPGGQGGVGRVFVIQSAA